MRRDNNNRPTPPSREKPRDRDDDIAKPADRLMLKTFNKENNVPKKSFGETTKHFFTPQEDLHKKRSVDNIKNYLYKNKSPEISTSKDSKASPLFPKKNSNSLKSDKRVTELDDSKNRLAKKKSDALLSSNQLLQKYQSILKNSSSNVFAPKQSACFLFKSKVK